MNLLKTLFISIILFTVLNAENIEKISLQLQWKHQFQFAGYYMAKEKGFFKEAGLEVEIKEFEKGINTTDEITFKRSDYAIGRASLVVDKSNGKDIVLLSSIFQSSPLVLLTTQVDKIDKIEDFKNKKIMLVNDSLRNTAIKAMIVSQGITYEDVIKQKHSFNLDDLINNKTDLMTSYISNEPYMLKQRGYEYKVFAPKDYGYDFYSDLLFTSKEEVLNNPKRVKKFVSAVIKGWEYAFLNMEESVNIIYKKYNSQNKTKESLAYEAQALKELAKLNEYELGFIDKSKIKKMYAVYNLLGVVKNKIDIDSFVYDDVFKNKFLFTPLEKDYLKKKKELKMCIDPNWMPFEKIQNGEHIGMSSEYIKMFQEKLPIPIKLVETKNWLESMKFAENRKCDFVSLMSESEHRKRFFNFSNPLMSMPLVVATTNNKPFVNNISSILDKKLAIVEGFAYAVQLKQMYPSIKLTKVKGSKDGLEKVKNGEIYGFIGVLPAIGYTIQENFVGEIKIAGKLDDSWDFKMASRNDEYLLNSILNKLINSISVKQNQDILNKWISIKYEESVDYTKVLFVLGIFLFVIIIVLIKNNSINRINRKLEEYIEVVDKNVLTSSTDLEGNITYASQAFCDISGYSKDEILGLNHRIIRHEDTKDELFEDLWNTIKSGKTWTGEIKNKKKDGGFYWIKATISPTYNEKKQIIGYTSIRHDITDKKLIEEISITDGLTNIYNRRHFNEISQKYLNSAKRKNEFIVFLIMDVDHFKEYNDTYGHQKGDKVLISISKTLKEKTHRADDFCFRLGGEEFGVLYKADTKEKAVLFAQMIKVSIENLFIEHEKNSASQFITVSVGLYCNYAQEIENFDEVYKIADELLYKSKESGRNCITVL